MRPSMTETNEPDLCERCGDPLPSDGLWVTDAFDKDSDRQLVFVGEGRGGTAVLLPARA